MIMNIVLGIVLIIGSPIWIPMILLDALRILLMKGDTE